MSRSYTSLAKYLWEEQHVVFLNSSNAHDFNLLDVLVKHGSHGIISRGPVLVRIGSIFQVGVAAAPIPASLARKFHDAEDVLKDDDDDEEDEVLQDSHALSLGTLKQEVEALAGSAAPIRGVHVKENKLGDWRWKNNASVSIMATATVMDAPQLAAAGSGVDWIGIGTIKNIKSRTVDTGSLHQVFSRCTLDVQQIRQRCSPTLREINEVWVVNKILYTSGIHVAGANQAAGGAQVQLPTVATIGLGVRSAQTSSHEVSNALDPQPFGFQAIRLKLNGTTGEVISCSMEMGKGRAVIRRNDHPQVDIMRDPQKEPEYNMADLLDIDIIDSSQLIIGAEAASVYNHDNSSVDSAVTEEIP